MTSKIWRPLSLDRLEAAVCSAASHPLLLLHARPYLPSEYAQLAKYILALANVAAPGARFIVVGVSENRELHDIDTVQQRDVAAAVATVGEYIEPHLQLKCFSWQVRNKTLAVISIGGCDNPPYLMSRDVKPALRAGDGWIRRHDRIRRLMRRDYERFYVQRFAEPMFSGNIRVQFAHDPPTEIVHLSPIAHSKPPSSEAKEKLEALIAAQELVDCAGNSQLTAIRRLSFARVLGSDLRYEPKSVEMLRAELKTIDGAFDETDQRFKFEQQSHPLNFVIEVAGDQPIRAATLVLHLPANVGIEVGDAQSSPKCSPQIQTTAATIRVSKSFDLLKPGSALLAFEHALRIHLDKRAIGYKFPVRYELRARNLQRAVVGKLFIVCPKHSKTKVA